MLFEKISYSDDFPINITIANVIEDPIHYHQDIEFVYILKGEVELKNGYCHYQLKEGDLFTNVGHEVHSIYGTGKENAVAIIQISTRYFSQYFPELSKSCYRTYSNHSSDERQDTLKNFIINILLQYTKKSFNYKSECINSMINVVDYLEKYFNLFGFKDSMVINYGYDNLINNNRISKIISYIYQYHADKITLEDLAEMEHLSTYYLSHLIKDCTGMSFRDFLCFARVEWSEIYLLGSTDKISTVAKKVGFSTTSYYEKYFNQWFGMLPSDYRNKYINAVKSDSHVASFTDYSLSKKISLLKAKYSGYNSQDTNPALVGSLKLDIDVNCNAPAIRHIDRSICVMITLDDFRQMRTMLFACIEELMANSILILTKPEDDPEAVESLKNILISINPEYEIMVDDISHYDFQTGIYARDSIAHPLYVLNNTLHSDSKRINAKLRDFDANGYDIIRGDAGLMTSNMIKKPGYYVCRALTHFTGDLILWGKQYNVFRKIIDGKTYYIVITTNFNDKILQLCGHETTAHEVSDTLSEFKDEIDFSYYLNLPEGKYCVMEYTLTKEQNIFNYMADMNFPKYVGYNNRNGFIDTSPAFQMYLEEVITKFQVNHSIKGPGIQASVIYSFE